MRLLAALVVIISGMIIFPSSVSAVAPQYCDGKLKEFGIIKDISVSPKQVTVQGNIQVTIDYETTQVRGGETVTINIWHDGIGHDLPVVGRGRSSTTQLTIPTDKASPITTPEFQIDTATGPGSYWVKVEISGISGSCKTPDGAIKTQLPPKGIDKAACNIKLSHSQFKEGEFQTNVRGEFSTTEFEYDKIFCNRPNCKDFTSYQLFLFKDTDGSIQNAVSQATVMNNLIMSSNPPHWRPTQKPPIQHLSFKNETAIHDITPNLRQSNLDRGNYFLLGVANERIGNANNTRLCSYLPYKVNLEEQSEASPLQGVTPISQAAVRNQIVGCTGDQCTKAAGIPCSDRAGYVGVLTAIGCVPYEPREFINRTMRFITGIAGAVALLLMAFGAIQMMASAGNPDNLKKGQEQFTSAIIGLLFIIFSTLLLQIIGVDILGLPGFSR